MPGKRIPLMGLGYVGFGARRPADWLEFGTEVCAMMPAIRLPGDERKGPPLATPELSGTAPDGSVYLKLDERQWRVAAHPAEEEGLLYYGLELASEPAVIDALETVASRGASARLGSSEECAARGVAALAVLEDPAGNRVELFSGPVRDKGFVSPHGAAFLTGGLGIGHVFLEVEDLEPNRAFYRDVLGFDRSDYMTLGPGMGIDFLRCTRRHHSVGLMRLGGENKLGHLMLEYTSLDMVGKALDRAMGRDVAISASLGRHRNDGTVSFYMNGPSGFDVELGWDGVLVGDDWVEHEFTGDGDEWGHHGLMGGDS